MGLRAEDRRAAACGTHATLITPHRLIEKTRLYMYVLKENYHEFYITHLQEIDESVKMTDTMPEKTLFMDMDNVFKFQSGIDQLNGTEKCLEGIYSFCNFAT